MADLTDSKTWRAKVLADLPRASRALTIAAGNRELAASRLRTDGPRMQGIDELLLHLDQVEAALNESDADESLGRLVGRLGGDFEIALEAAISGYLPVVMDAMRDVMEATDLILMFSTDLALASAWSAMPDKDRWKKFGPAPVRKHLQQASYRNDADATADYRGHSARLHVNPHPIFLGDRPFPPDIALVSDVPFWEIFYHARDLVFALDILRDIQGFDWRTVQRAESLDKVAAAFEHTRRLQQMFMSAVEDSSDLANASDMIVVLLALRHELQHDVLPARMGGKVIVGDPDS